MSTDFRTEAAEATLSKVRSMGGRSVGDLDESGCVFIEGGRGLRYAVEVPNFLIIIGCWILFLAVILLGLLGVFSEGTAVVVMLAGFAVALVVRKVRSILLKVFLSRRS